MSNEPDFLSQNGEDITTEQRDEWFKARTDEAKAAGATLARYSIHPDIPHLALFEAWIKPPKNFEQGEPRWQLAAMEKPHA